MTTYPYTKVVPLPQIPCSTFIPCKYLRRNTRRKGLYLNGDFDEIKKYILQGNKVDQHIRFFLGYCGWEGEQLNDELKENTWLVSKEDKDYLMNSDTKDMWKEALEKLGSKYEAWSRFPRVPTFN